jgi:hypothetical protein
MMKIKLSDTTPIQIDWLVAKCEDILHPWGHIRILEGRVMWISPGNHEVADSWHHYSPSTDWLEGGPIIERENVGIVCQQPESTQRCAYRQTNDGEVFYYYGPTPLIAAMRCYVASKLGDEVEVPEELL